MSKNLRRVLSVLLVICLSLAIVPVALMEETDTLQTVNVDEVIQGEIGNLEEASTNATTEDEVIETSGTDSEVAETGEEIAFGDLEQNSSEEVEEFAPAVEEQAEPFNQEATIDDVVIGVSGTANAFPQGATLRVEKVEDETVVEAVEALLSAQEVCAHFQYRIEVLDASGNAIVPNEGDELPVICVKGIDVAEETKAAYYDAVSEAACLIEAETGEGEMRFAFVASAIYDIVTVKAEEDQQEQPSEEEQPSKDEQTSGEEQPSKDEQTQENAVKTGEDAEGSEKNEDSSEEKADSEGEEKEAEDQDAAKEVWQTAEVIPTDDVIEMDDAEMDEAAKLMEANSALAAAATYEYLPSILTVGDVYDLNKCLLIDGYNPSDIVSRKSSRSSVVKIARDGTLTALKKGSAKITVKTNDRKKRTIRVSVKKNAINGIYSKPSKSEAVALGEAFSIMPKSLKHTGKRIEAEFYLLNGSNKRIRYLRDLDLEIYLGSRKNKLVGGVFSKIKVSSKKRGVSTFKVAFPASSALMKNVHFADYPANQIYYSFSTKYFYSTAGRSGVPFEETVIPNLPDIVYVTAITLNNSSLSLTKGNTAQLTATAYPTNAENRAINWSTNNPFVATVDNNGKVTAKAAGNATIYATAADGSGKSAACTVTVTDSSVVIKPQSLTLNETSVTVVIGETETITSTLLPANASDTRLIHSMSPEGYFKTSGYTTGNIGTFNVEGVKEGTATLKIASKSDPNIIASCTVYVVKSDILVTNLIMSQPSAELQVGNTMNLSVTVSPSNATNQSVNWSSSNSNVATVDSNGVVTAKGTGNATITATSADGTGIKRTCAVKVVPRTDPVIKISSLSMSKTSASLDIGDTLSLSVTVSPSNATNKSVTWSSTDTSVATVNTNGVVTAKKAGNANIKATAADGSGVTATCRVTVNTPEPYGEFNVYSLTVMQGKTVEFNVAGGVRNSTHFVYTVNGNRPDGSELNIPAWSGIEVSGKSKFASTMTVDATASGPFYTPGNYTLKLWVRDATTTNATLTDSINVEVQAASLGKPEYVQIDSCSFVARTDTVKSTVQEGTIFDQTNYPLDVGRSWSFPYSTGKNVLKVSYTVSEKNTSNGNWYQYGNLTGSKTFSSGTSGQSGTFTMNLPSDMPSGTYLLRVYAKNVTGDGGEYICVKAYIKVKGTTNEAEYDPAYPIPSLTGTNQDKLVQVASSQLGYTEKGDNHSVYGAFTGTDGYPWCAPFVSWCASKAGLSSIFITSGTYADPDDLLKKGYSVWYFKTYNDYDITKCLSNASSKTYDFNRTIVIPRKGDLIFFESSKGACWAHVGIITDYDSSKKTITYIDGNGTNEGGTLLKGKTGNISVSKWSIALSAKYICAIARPKY